MVEVGLWGEGISMLVEKDGSVDRADNERRVCDLIRALTDHHADPSAARRCLRQLAEILERLGDQSTASLVSSRLRCDRLSKIR